MHLRRDSLRPVEAIAGLRDWRVRAARGFGPPGGPPAFSAAPQIAVCAIADRRSPTIRGRAAVYLALGISLAFHAVILSVLLLVRSPESLKPSPGEIAVSLVLEAPTEKEAEPVLLAEPAVPAAPDPTMSPAEPPAPAATPEPLPPEPALPSPAATPIEPMATAPSSETAEPPPATPEIAVQRPAPTPRVLHRKAPASPGPASIPRDTVANQHGHPAPSPSAPAEIVPTITVPAHPVAGLSTNRPPVYPPLAQRRGEEGLVLLRVAVSADGQASSVTVLRGSGHESLDEAAMAAVRKWQFVPATRNNTAIAALADVPVDFKLSR